MMTDVQQPLPGHGDSGLPDGALAGVYCGPPEEFVRRRDTLAKELRSAGDRELANSVKSLRKPSRIAWALDVAAIDADDVIGPLITAVAETLDANATGGDVRSANARLRAAVRAFAARAEHLAAEAGHRTDAGALANAVLAVLAHPESLNQLRGGYLAEVPESGGLDFLAALPAPPASAKAAEPSDAQAPSQETAHAAAAREAALRAAGALAEARARSEDARRVLRDAESRLQDAEVRLRHAEAEVRSARGDCDRARQEADAAHAMLAEAERAAMEA